MQSLAPERLGRSFRWLLASVVVANTGDGIALAAGPLLIASETSDPLLVASGFFFQQLPWLLFGVVAGAYVDRLDRRRLIVAVDSLRALVVGVLALTVASGTVNVPVILVTMFALGTAETVSDLTSQTLVVGAVDKVDLGTANARLQGGFIAANQLVGPPLGAFLFAVLHASPFAATAACYLLGAVLVSRIALRPRELPERRSVRHEVAEGFRWLWHHAPVRTLAITIFLFNVTFGAAWGVLVLYADQRLDMSTAGYGWLMTASALGGLLATSTYDWLQRRVSLADLMRVGLVLETLTHLALALTTQAWFALCVLFVFGAHAVVWGTTSTTVRQRAVPDALQGRVASVSMISSVVGLLVGVPIGGVLARHWGITAPFWFGFVGSAVLVLLLWRELAHVAHAGEVDPSG